MKIPVTICLASVVLGASALAAQQPSTPAPRQLVIPFENTNREARAYWLTEGSAVLLSDDLSALGVQVIRRDDRLRAFDRLHVPTVASLSHATVIRVGQVVGAAEVIVGSFELRGEELTVRARAIRLDTGRMAPEIVERGPFSDTFGVYGRVARRLVPLSRVSVEEMEQGHPPIAAFEAYIKGLVEEMPAAKISFFTQALGLAPASFQRPRIALWEAYTDQGEHQRALAAVRDVPADHRLGREARFLGAVSMTRLGQYQEAFDAFIELNRARPDPAVLNNLGIVQLRRSPATPGSRASAYFVSAAELDGTDSDLFFNAGYAYWIERDGAKAITWLREAVRRNPADEAAHYVLGVALLAAGSDVEAAREKELARRLSSEYARWDARQTAANAVPRGLERLKTEVDVPAALRVENTIVAAGQRDQRELAQFHLEAGRRAFEADRDAEAIAELRRAVYLSPYQSEAHLLLGRAYLRTGRVQEAINALKISLWSLDTVAARIVLAEAYIQARDVATARSELQTVMKLDPGNAEARRLIDSLPQ